MTLKTLALAAFATVALTSASHAVTITVSTTPFTVGNFGNSSTPGFVSSAPIVLSNGTITFTPNNSSPNAGVYSGNVVNVASSPYGAGSTANYLVAEPNDPATITFTTPQTSFGLLWGSPDTYNSITFSDGSVVTGSQIIAQDPTQAPVYVTISGFTAPITTARLTSTTAAFEFSPQVQVSAVPEPASLALLGAGLAGVGFIRRRRA